MLEVQAGPPIAFSLTVQQATVHLRQNNIEPTKVVVRFGEGTMENIPADVLRRVFSVSRLWGVPVEFPEQRGPVEGMIEVTAEAADRYSRFMLSWEMLVHSY